MEKVYVFKQSMDKLIEKVLDDDEVMINHIILNQGESLPQHDSNSNVYMLIVRGAVTVACADKAAVRYAHGSIVNIPGKVSMRITNADLNQAEFFVIKAPSPRLYGKNAE